MMKFGTQAHLTPTERFKQKKWGFNLGRLQKHKFKVFFTAISKTKRAWMMNFCMQAHLTPTKRFKQKIDFQFRLSRQEPRPRPGPRPGPRPRPGL